MPPPPDLTPHSHTHRWAQLDELVVDGNPVQVVTRLQQMDASSRERMLVAGVRALVGGTAVLLSCVERVGDAKCLPMCSFIL